jgi:hypothetical protein
LVLVTDHAQVAGKLSLATFNCEWRRTSSDDASLIRERVLIESPHVVCLTETHHDFLAQCGGYTITSAPPVSGPGMETRRKVLLWSRNPWTDVDTTGPQDLPKGRYAAAKTNTPAGEVRFVGVVIPYRFAGVRFGEPKRRSWELHLQYLEALDRYLPEQPERTIVLGDFNQRVPRKYQPLHVYDELQRVLLSRFNIITDGVLRPVERQAIDHVCISRDLAWNATRTISNERPDGGQISDHFGVRVEVSPAKK